MNQLNLSDYSTYSIAVVGLIFVVILLIILFMFPSGQRRKRKKKRPPEQLPREKDWKATALKLERYINSLRSEIEEHEKRERISVKKTEELDAKVAVLRDKISQQDGWHDKEQNEIDRKSNEITKLKEALTKADNNVGEEHTKRIRAEKEYKELKDRYDGMYDEKRKAENEYLLIKGKVESLTTEVRELRRENRELQKQEEDKSFVAKSDYEALKDKLRKIESEKDNEIRRLNVLIGKIKEEMR